MHLASKFLRNISLSLMFVAIGCSSSPAFAGCTWYFNWSCSDCKLGARTTGTQGGYSSYDSCNSARGSVDSMITAHSCQSEGYCDSPAATPSPGYGGGTGYQQPQQQIYVPHIDYEAESRRQQAEQRRLDKEEAERQAKVKAEEEKRRREFLKDKSEALGSLKGGVDFDGTGGGELKIKTSSESSTGLKDGSSSDLGLKDGSSTVYTGSDKFSVVDPRDIKGKQKYTKIFKTEPPSPVRDVPKKDVTRLGGEVANIVMDAIIEGGHDLEKSEDILRELLRKHPESQNLRDASSYIIGMALGHSAAGIPAPKISSEQVAREKARTLRIEARFEFSDDQEMNDELIAMLTNKPLSNRANGFDKWLNERNEIFLDAITKHQDYHAVFTELEKRAKADPDNMALRGALRIAQGAEVYQGDIKRRKTLNTLNK